MKYVQLIHVYHEYSRSLREGDLHGYISCLPKFTNMFFALNHPSYARWTVKHHNSLLTLEETHLETFREYQDGMFRINRTTKPFSGNPIDLTLEQTVNADAASQRTGIVSMTNSISARQRWAESHFLRTTVISYLHEDLNLTKQEDITESLKASNINKYNLAVKEIKSMIENSLNPFKKDADPHRLFNIYTGKSCKKGTEDFLLNVESIGNEARKNFIQECVENPNQFEERIKKNKILSFATESGKRKIRGAEGKNLEATLIRDLFVSILCLSMQRKIDMVEVLNYPLTPAPLCLSHVDGSVDSTPKSNLLNYIDKQFVTVSPSSIDATLIDAAFFLHLQINPADTFGGIARSILNQIMQYSGNIIHFVADKWLTP